MNKYNLGAFFLLGMCLLAAPVWITGQTYELDYSIVSNGGGESTSGNYAMESVVKVVGVEASTQSSISYSLENPMAEAEPPAAVEDWMLH